MGNYFCEETNRLDPKWRVCLPSILRQQLPEDGRDAVYSYLDVKEPRVLLFDNLFMSDLMDKMSIDNVDADLASLKADTVDDLRAIDKLRDERTSQRSAVYSSVSSGFLTRVSLLKMDDAGRLTLTQRMRDHAKLDRDVYFCGLGRAIGVYEPKIFEKNYLDNTAEGEAARRHVEELMRGLP